jgi:hypothetical protein
MAWANLPTERVRGVPLFGVHGLTSEQRSDLATHFSDWCDEVKTTVLASVSTVTDGTTIVEDAMIGRIYHLEIADRWHHGRICLVGDAAHANGPGGQGAALALEDTELLAALLQRHGVDDFARVFAAFTRARLARVKSISSSTKKRLLAKRRAVSPVGWMASKLLYRTIAWYYGASFNSHVFGYKLRLSDFDDVDSSSSSSSSGGGGGGGNGRVSNAGGVIADNDGKGEEGTDADFGSWIVSSLAVFAGVACLAWVVWMAINAAW